MTCAIRCRARCGRGNFLLPKLPRNCAQYALNRYLRRTHLRHCAYPINAKSYTVMPCRMRWSGSNAGLEWRGDAGRRGRVAASDGREQGRDAAACSVITPYQVEVVLP